MGCWLYRFSCLAVCVVYGSAPGTLRAEKPIPEPALTVKDRAHWAFQVPKKQQLLQVKNASWVRTPIDTFTLAKLEQAGLTPTPPASRATLLRRLYFDLI